MRRIPVVVALSVLLRLPPVPAHAQTEGAPCPVEPTDHLITYGEVVTCTISPAGDADLFRFVAVGNERVIIQVATLTGFREPCFRIFSPSNVLLWTACNGSGNNRVLATLNEPGTYSIQVFEGGNDETADYTLVLERLLPGSPVARPIGFGATLTDRVDPIGELDVVTFTARAGANVELRVAALEGFREPCVEMIDPDSVRTVGCTGGGTSAIMRILPLDGTYTAFVHENGQDEATNYSLTLNCLSGTCLGSQVTLPVPANAPWVDSGVDLVAGQEVGTRATASWRADPSQPLFGPLGLPEPCASAGCPIDANHGGLVAKIGSGPPFVVGEAFAFFAPSSGRLYFMINDDVNALGDNTGSAAVYVLYSSPPLGVDLPGSREAAHLLGAPVPNPFVESSELRFRVSERSSVTLRVYDMAGRLVRSLYETTPLEVGEHVVNWDGRGEDGLRSAPGVYFYRLGLAGHQETRRAILLR